MRLLETLAASMSVALENARLFDETQRLLKETEARNTELAVINSIQDGMAKELNFQAIVDLVGDTLRNLFGSNMGIFWLDEPGGLIHFPYAYEHGQRLHLPPHALAKFATGRRWYDDILARKTVVWHNQDEYRDLELFVAEGTDMSRSGVIAPIFAGDRLLGMLDVENHEKDNAYGDADVRLLSTVAASMGVALENARLFDETQRLLKETERRSSELAVINSIQQGMAAELNFQAIVDLVGDKLRELFNTGDMSIRWRDESDRPRSSVSTVYEHGKRLFAAARAVQARLEARPGIAEGRAGRAANQAECRCAGHQDGTRNRYEPVQRFPADHCRRPLARFAQPRELRARGRLQRCGSEAPEHRRRVDGGRARERAPARGDAAPRARGRRRWPRWGATCRRRWISPP